MHAGICFMFSLQLHNDTALKGIDSEALFVAFQLLELLCLFQTFFLHYLLNNNTLVFETCNRS